MSTQAFVSIVTPVYNGARFLKDCIESALAQTYADFEMIILDNASTDETGAIAATYANRDSRIHIYRNERTLPIVENWNRALELISVRSRYCRVLHADDMMLPKYLEASIAVAERHPEIGIVGCLRARGTTLQCEGLPRNKEAFSGRDIVRLFLREQVFALAPTSNLVRADLVRARRRFYPTGYLHADLAAYFDLLRSCDFGFVHEMLAFSRVHENSVTATIAEPDQTILKEWLLLLQHYGPDFFTPTELAEIEQAFLRRYYRALVRGAILTRRRSFLAYHLAGLRKAHRSPTALDIARAAGEELVRSLQNPSKFMRHIAAAYRPSR